MMERAARGAGVMTKRKPVGTGTASGDPSAPSIQPPFAQHVRFTTWRYTVAGVTSTLVMVSSEPITRAEALKSLAQHYGYHNLLSLKGGQDAR